MRPPSGRAITWKGLRRLRHPSLKADALFKDGKLVHVLERRHIETMNEEMVAQNLIEAFDEHCSRQGPSVSKEVYDGLATSRQCGSSVPAFNPFR